jgi:hypothetical protein
MRRLLLIAVAVLPCLTSAAQAQVYGDPTSLVDYWYRTFLGRGIDPGASGWVTQLSQGVSADKILAAILSSDEYYGRAGRTPQGFIALLYGDVLKRPPNPAELNFWVRRMYTEDRATIADELLAQNPGVWVGTGAAVTPPATVTIPSVVTPGIDWGWHRDWDRDRRRDWDRHHDIHEYRQPDFHFRGGEHPEHRR